MITIVGIGCDGPHGITARARQAISTADILVGGQRHLDMVSALNPHADTHTWPRPLAPGIAPLFGSFPASAQVTVLASGDPLFHGVGTTLLRELPGADFTVYPHVSSATLACARLGWTVEDTPVVSLTTSHPDEVVPLAQSGRRFLVLGTPGAVAAALGSDYGNSALTALADLGGTEESITHGTVAAPPEPGSSLVVTAVEPSGPQESALPGLVDDQFLNDGQLTKQAVRVHGVTALRPLPNQHLWDIGGGAGSIAIEFCRSTPGTSARVFERNEERATRIEDNAQRLGVSRRVSVSRGDAGTSIAGLTERPDAVFIGGGLSDKEMVDAAYAALVPGGRIVAHAVTLESVGRLVELCSRYGGELTSVAISKHHAVGRFTTLQPALPVIQWVAVKETES
ncbi:MULTISPECIES: bifunctional cobalt-precorrin-7 (C(5))-methyltransferase/cobalt-precorrin-6B (C(15))-methyltransferase [Corynebacterium]|uniref:Bifunctional cobalt-precorrin-7 (C(5))-methyltransferase/cobalt-precorrin-6B (C(15))-methyltransferase n=2 Tax=Corynebacterium glucuronolyticum TaxID=39791 RepID=A0AAX1LCU7_9CORY|nr:MULTISPECIES: bifunctional cobalt-precorrin-7 (C(5))-methyltransferase/cobalt-precorrin-6B (C(15))-methyltransferase [Corynebacterium]EEI26444.1 precorrin-6y C5,15-methyltransferase (decarboxylating), CbiE subunit [Corynebacterium glucuronolyticum ATCC 51867]EEI63081.1 precorrin-6y C5,15-methyltransferase (decarboxylating), CbiE subunit [Corynebacterium glucuronolyticum ATCC 51866]MCT1562685.1 bifunctional cobalt-precorrin-7 (C(5))-methyltransferase/cobalt-precorrin-6B (C(15))-methyltransfera